MQTSTEIHTNPVAGRVPTPFRSPVYYIYPIRTAAGEFELSGNGEGHPIDSHQQSTKSLTNRRTVKSGSSRMREVYPIDSYKQSAQSSTNRGNVSQKSALGIRHLIDVLLYMVGGAYALAH